MTCPHCNNETGPGARFCPACGSPVDREAPTSRCAGIAQFVDGEIVFSDHQVAIGRTSARKCPRCVKLMNVQSREGVEVDVCAECGGMWFDVGELNRLLQKHARLYTAEEVKDIRKTIGPPNVITERVQYIKCPVCAQLMNRANYGKFSGVIVDKCRDHGLWLDRGEYEKIAEFVAKGGLELEKVARTEEDVGTKLGQSGSQQTTLPPEYDEDRPRMRTGGKSWLESVLTDIFGFGKW